MLVRAQKKRPREQIIIAWQVDFLPCDKHHSLLKGRHMNNIERTLHSLLLAGAVALTLSSVTNPAVAAVDVTIGVPVPGVVVDPADPYYYSPTYCAGCWYGEWGGRIGYHRGGGRPWERAHVEADHHGPSDRRGGDVHHEGHR
jgi:hypothetical protein